MKLGNSLPSSSLTHPIIEEAKQIAKEIEKDNKMNR
jgi:hypothetical protein